MKTFFHIALASVVVVMMSLVPASAFASSKNDGGSHTRSQTYRDRTPTVHTHTSHRHR